MENSRGLGTQRDSSVSWGGGVPQNDSCAVCNGAVPRQVLRFAFGQHTLFSSVELPCPVPVRADTFTSSVGLV